MNISSRIIRLSRAQRALLEQRLTPEATTQLPNRVEAPHSQAVLRDWLHNNRSWLESQLLDTGAVLFRGFQVEGAADFERCIKTAFGKATDYPGLAQGVVLRKQIHGKISTSTEYSPAFHILLHNECSFADTWPGQIGFYCIDPPTTGGETPIADVRRVLASMSQGTRQKLEQLGVLYVRNFGYGSSRSWQKAFNTDNPKAVEKTCSAEGVDCEWLDENHLRTSARRPALAIHPVTGETVWFNHIHASHVSSLEPHLRETLMREFGAEGLPRNCYYGDGSEIEDSVIDEINNVYKEHTKAFQWQAGDVMFLDNMLTSHGRNPFTGSRKIAVGMAGSITRAA